MTEAFLFRLVTRSGQMLQTRSCPVARLGVIVGFGRGRRRGRGRRFELRSACALHACGLRSACALLALCLRFACAC